MAYSNWGAFVHSGDPLTRRTDREDVAVFGDDGGDVPAAARIWVHLLRAKEDGSPQAGWEGLHHAVLGDGLVRLTGYKASPRLYVVRDHAGGKPMVDRVDMTQFVTEREIERGRRPDGSTYEWATDYAWAGRFEGCHLEAAMVGDMGNLIDLAFVEADGTQWHARCGFEYGAGHMD